MRRYHTHAVSTVPIIWHCHSCIPILFYLLFLCFEGRGKSSTWTWPRNPLVVWDLSTLQNCRKIAIAELHLPSESVGKVGRCEMSRDVAPVAQHQFLKKTRTSCSFLQRCTFASVLTNCTWQMQHLSWQGQHLVMVFRSFRLPSVGGLARNVRFEEVLHEELLLEASGFRNRLLV